VKEQLKTIYYQSMVYAYALMQQTSIDDINKDELYITQTKQIIKYFSKRKPKITSTKDLNVLKAKQTAVKELDLSYFEDKLFSPFIVAIMLLDYLIREKRDVEMRSRFGHFDTKAAIDEIEKYFKENGVAKSHQKFVNKILDIVGD